ncbi:hypothetical protein BV22DRAFT_866488 [Leucogyrophana mollusca]|uniref:Uncharacterized protein n=1 Tax=Leucogyrophana mollusca TaxID=85980 RepID=A0ACB8B0X8_9AGAM|nr:hypothetical protein BV22DRAFT_866488 [Leucogyrophana mollusca]
MTAQTHEVDVRRDTPQPTGVIRQIGERPIPRRQAVGHQANRCSIRPTSERPEHPSRPTDRAPNGCPVRDPGMVRVYSHPHKNKTKRRFEKNEGSNEHLVSPSPFRTQKEARIKHEKIPTQSASPRPLPAPRTRRGSADPRGARANRRGRLSFSGVGCDRDCVLRFCVNRMCSKLGGWCVFSCERVPSICGQMRIDYVRTGVYRICVVFDVGWGRDG